MIATQRLRTVAWRVAKVPDRQWMRGATADYYERHR
jgi:hypothetical protein